MIFTISSLIVLAGYAIGGRLTRRGAEEDSARRQQHADG